MTASTSIHGLVAAVLALSAPIISAGEPGSDNPPSKEPVPADIATAHLALPEGFKDESALADSIDVTVADAVQNAEALTAPEQRADALLKAVNVVLARQLEPACSARLLELDREGNAQAVEKICDRADAMLADVAGILEGDGVDLANEGWAELKQRHGTLQAFAASLRALLTKDPDGDGQSARRAASRLSILLEDRDPRVAAAAALWQAALRAGEDDPSPALFILDRPLSTLRPDTMPYTFFSRLLRCRLVARRGGYPAAVTLLAQMEELCHEWFTEASARADAVRAVALTEIQVLGAWRAKLTGSDEKTWCDQKISHLRQSRFADGSALKRLDNAVPILVDPQDRDRDEGG